MVGETISHYKVIEKIGQGGMGEVYRAEWSSQPVRATVFSLLFFLSLFPVIAQSRAVVIQSTTLIDGRTGRAVSETSIVIQDGRIQSVGDVNRVEVPSDARIIDGQGKWVIPGLVDVHTHSAQEGALRRFLALGFTTVHLMPGRSVPDNPGEVEKRSESPENHTPRLHLSPIFSGGFPESAIPGLHQFKPKTVLEARQAVRGFKQLGFRSIKIIQEDGLPWMGSAVAPRLLPEVFAALVDEAQRLDMRVYVHTTQLVDTRAAILAGLNAFMHGTMDTLIDDSLWGEMLSRKIVWTPTYRVVLAEGDPPDYAQRILSDTKLTESLLDAELSKYRSDVSMKAADISSRFPGLAPNLSTYVSNLHQNTQHAQSRGVTIALGSDGGPPGLGSHLEMEFLYEAGLTPAQVIVAATYGGATALGVDDEIGSIEFGKLADLVVLTADPLEDIRNARKIEWVIKGGVPVKPKEILASSASQE